MSKRSTAGFTLVEILVVIAIMAILAAIIIPAYLSVERSQKLNGCMNHLRAIGVALAMYHEDWGAYPPPPPPEYLAGAGVNTAYLAYLPFSSGTGLQYAGTSPANTPTSSLTISGTYNGPPLKILVKIANTGPPDSFTWSANNGATWAPNANIPTITIAPNPPETVPAPLGATNVSVKFGTDTGHFGDEVWTFWVGVDHVKQYGLAALYWEYLNDQHDYVRSRNIYHCPAMVSTENVDIGGNLAALRAQDPVNQQLRKFDPLWAGYNTYDVTYNYDQYTGSIQKYDDALGFGSQDTGRTLANPRAPADTVVCWCYAHNKAQSPSFNEADPNQPDELGDAQSAARAVRTRRSEVNVVLWVDGSVDMMRPYLTQAKDDKAGLHAYYWTPPCLYAPEGGVR